MQNRARHRTQRAGQADAELLALVEGSRRGDRACAELLVRRIRPPIYGLSLRMSERPAEAEDATQEILLVVLGRLGSFRGDSRFLTWVYAVAANHLRNRATRGPSRNTVSLDEMRERCAVELRDAAPPRSEAAVVCHELFELCLRGCLLYLDRDHRLAFVLGEVVGLSGTEGARVLGISPSAFRKRLSRARRRMRDFALGGGGLASREEEEGCERRSTRSGRRSWHDLTHLDGFDELKRIHDVVENQPHARAPGHLLSELTEVLGRRREAA